MKAISVWQPWASLLFAPGEFRKVYETRPRTLGFVPGERIAIQAAATAEGLAVCRTMDLCDEQRISEAIAALYGPCFPEDLPRGCIIGTVEVQHWQHTANGYWVSEQERAFGNWAEGRVAIPTRAPTLFAKPIPCIGKQGVFRVDDAMIKGHEHANV